MSISQIAKKLSRNKSTISREIKRNSNIKGYDPKFAQEKSKLRRWHNYMFRWFKFYDFSILFKTYFNKRWSGVWVTYLKIKNLKLDMKMPSFRHVYNMINSCHWLIHPWERLKPKYMKRYGIRKFNYHKFAVNKKFVLPIALRPNCINKRSRYTDYELDLICGTVKEKHSGYLVVLVNRTTRQAYAKYSKSKNDFVIAGIVKKIIEENKLIVDSITPDRGKEFDRLSLVAKWLNFKIYQCDPYRSWQKGTVENLNGIIRRYFDSSTNFSKITDEQIQFVLDKINNMPRKMFHGLSANEYAKVNF